MVGSLLSSSVISPQQPPSGASFSALNGRLQVLHWLCSTTICGQIDRMYIYRDTWIMHAILWGSESCDCNKDKYDSWNALCLWNPKNHCYNCRCFQEHLRMLLQSLRGLCKAPGGPQSIWKYLKALVKTTGVSRRFTCGCQTNWHFADIPNEPIPTYGHSWPQRHSICLQ